MTERARTRRVVIAVGTVLVLAVLLALLVPYALAPRRSADAPATLPAPVESAEADEMPSPEPAPFPSPPPGCPGADIPPLGTIVTVEWVPTLVANGRTYWGEQAGVFARGDAVTTVRCDISALSGGGQALVPLPWPDGSSTVLAEGTQVYAIAGSPAACYLAAEDTYGTWLFSAVDEEGDPPLDCADAAPPG